MSFVGGLSSAKADSGEEKQDVDANLKVRSTLSPLLRKVFLVDLVKGLSVTFHNQSEKERITEQYPLERPVIYERYRGQPRLNVNPDTGESLCIVCNLCALACPEQLIVVKGERNPVTKRKEVVSWTYDLSRCMFCGLCEEACSTDALELTQDYEMALYSREGMLLDQAALEKGQEPVRYAK